jgi:hypothetical protein
MGGETAPTQAAAQAEAIDTLASLDGAAVGSPGQDPKEPICRPTTPCHFENCLA